MAPLKVDVKAKPKAPATFALPDLFIGSAPSRTSSSAPESSVPEAIEETRGGPLLQSSLRSWLKPAARPAPVSAPRTKRKAEGGAEDATGEQGAAAPKEES